jgi:hypothetical protein
MDRGRLYHSRARARYVDRRRHPKTPLDSTAGLDDPPRTSNGEYVPGYGTLKTAWFGGITRTGSDIVVP